MTITKQHIIRPKDLATKLGISETTLWRWRRDSKLPQPISLGPRMIGWRATDIDDWFESIKLEGSIQ